MGGAQPRLSSSDSDDCRLTTRDTSNKKDYAVTARLSYGYNRHHPGMAASSYFMPTDSAEMDR